MKCLVSDELYWQMRREDIHAGKPKDFTSGRSYAWQCRLDGYPLDADRQIYLMRRSGIFDYNLELYKEGIEYQQNIFNAARFVQQITQGVQK